MRTAIRVLRRHPGFTILAILSPAVGLGLITALLSLAEAILFRPLPVSRPGEVVRIVTTSRDQPMGFVSYPDFLDLRGAIDAVAETQVLIAAGDPPRVRMGLAVTPDYFDVLGVPAAIGRTFHSGEEHAPMVVLAHAFWRTNPVPVGGTIRLGKTPFTVIGIAPENFGLDRFLHEDFYVSTGAFAAGLLPATGRPLEDRGRRFFTVFARVHGTIDSARAAVAAAGAKLEAQFPETNRGRRALLLTESEARLRSDKTMPALARILVAVTALIAAITAANFAGLMFMRTLAQARDRSIRVALGATRGRMLRDHFAQSALLCGAALALGLPLGAAAARALAHSAVLPTDFHFAIEPMLSRPMTIAAAMAAVLVALCGSLAPKPVIRSAVIAAEIALATMLTAAGAMLIEKTGASQRIHLGYRTEGIFVAALDPAQAGSGETRTRVFYDQLLRRLRALPGVRRVALAQSVPLGYAGAQREIAFEGDREKLVVWMNTVTPEYFDLMRIRPVAGRTFDDREAAPVAVVNREFARRCGLGCRFRMNGREVLVIGIVPAAKYFYLGEPARPYFYLPYSQNYASRMIVHVEGGAPREILEEIRRLDPAQAVSETRMLSDYASQGATFHTRIALDAVGFVGTCGLGLALVGLFGIVSHEAARRRREIPIRVALGASRLRIVALVLRKGITLATGGALAGWIAALAGARWLAAATDPGGFDLWRAPAMAALAVIAIAGIAAFLPAWRASRVDPAGVLRIL
ncbi:MAG: ABC transporter permease [Acidobacteriia bacterium]|nr:ABC transporter permease [Terriglobia bacterium]